MKKLFLALVPMVIALALVMISAIYLRSWLRHEFREERLVSELDSQLSPDGAWAAKVSTVCSSNIATTYCWNRVQLVRTSEKTAPIEILDSEDAVNKYDDPKVISKSRSILKVKLIIAQLKNISKLCGKITTRLMQHR